MSQVPRKLHSYLKTYCKIFLWGMKKQMELKEVLILLLDCCQNQIQLMQQQLILPVEDLKQLLMMNLFLGLLKHLILWFDLMKKDQFILHQTFEFQFILYQCLLIMKLIQFLLLILFSQYLDLNLVLNSLQLFLLIFLLFKPLMDLSYFHCQSIVK